MIILGFIGILPSLYSAWYFNHYFAELQQLDPGRLGIAQLERIWRFSPCSRIARQVDPNGAFAKAGGKEGDAICNTHHRLLENAPYLTPMGSKEVALQVNSGGQSRTLYLSSTNLNDNNPAHWIEGYGQPLSNIVLVIVGLLIGWRGADFAHLRYLSLGMLLWGLLLPMYVSEQSFKWLDPIAHSIQLSLPCFIAFVLTAPEMRSATSAPAIQALRRGLPLYLMLCFLQIGWEELAQYNSWNGMARDLGQYALLALSASGYAALVTALLVYRQLSHGPERERLDLMVPLFCLTLVVQILPAAYYFFPGWHTVWLAALEYLMTLLLPLALGYAILRYRVLDLGYAMNRAIFFSLITLVMAVTFGFIEFSVKSRIPKDYGTMVSTVLGIGVILSFRHIHHWLEQVVQHLFFHDWNVKAEHFRHQIARIAHINQPDLMLQRFSEAVQELAPTESIAIYVQPKANIDQLEHDYILRTEAPLLPPLLDYNHALMAELRGGSLKLESEEVPELAKDLPFRLAFALQSRGRVLGAVLLGQKNDDHRYRPDEIAILQDACNHIALDLETLEMHRLQAQHLQMQRDLASLQQQLQVARLEAEVAQLQLFKQAKA